jgi:hypothetical protein
MMHFWKLRRKVASPARFSGCAVAVALPMTQKEFEQDIAETNAEHDFAREFLQGFLQDYSGRSSHSAWSLGYAHHVQALSKVLDFAKELGVEVVLGATLADFRHLLAAHHTVTLFGHFRGWEVRPDELADESALANALRSTSDPAWRHLRAAMESLEPAARFTAGAPGSTASALSTVMNAQLLFDDVPARQGAQRAPYPARYWPWKNRQALSVALPCLANPRVYEFRDGLKRLDEVAAGIPEAFAGTIDFIVCNSIFLAEVAQQRPDCRIIASYETQNLGRRALVYEAILKIMQKGNLSYLDAVTQLHAAWIERERQAYVGTA